jgi:DNA-directed RNA polymerase subunit RPC12/RpoP
MVNYNCPRCGYNTNKLSNFKSHLERINICKALINDTSQENLIDIYNKIITKEDSYKCDYCNKTFRSSQGKFQHKKRCQDKPTSTDDKIDKLVKTVEDLKNKLNTINNTTNINTTNNTQNITNINLKLRDFGRENMEALPGTLINSLFMDLRFRELLANLHCDPNYPENQNVRIKSIKRNTMEIFRNNKWDIMTFAKGLTELLLQGHKIFKDYYDKDKERILEEDMSEQEIKDVLNQLEKIERLNKEELRPLLMDLKMMLEEYGENGHAIIIV